MDGPSSEGTIETTRPSRTPASNAQPTPQYAQMVRTRLVGMPSRSTVFSVSAPVGHSFTQAPQETQVEEAIPSLPVIPALPHAGRLENPAPTIETAKAG